MSVFIIDFLTIILAMLSLRQATATKNMHRWPPSTKVGKGGKKIADSGSDADVIVPFHFVSFYA